MKTVICLLAFVSLPSLVSAADHRVEPIKEAAPADEVSAEIAAVLNPTGFRVIRGTSRTVCDVWLTKQWSVAAGFKPTDEVLYPFQPGQLIGVVRYPRKGSDFRDQDIASGVYTMRYAQQPVDGSHVGTSPTRDFVLLVSAKQDTSPKVVGGEELVDKSSEAAGSSHPAMLCLQRVRTVKPDAVTMRHEERHDWWIVQTQGIAVADTKKSTLPLEIVMVGISAE